MKYFLASLLLLLSSCSSGPKSKVTTSEDGLQKLTWIVVTPEGCNVYAMGYGINNFVIVVCNSSAHTVAVSH